MSKQLLRNLNKLLTIKNVPQRPLSISFKVSLVQTRIPKFSPQRLFSNATNEDIKIDLQAAPKRTTVPTSYRCSVNDPVIFRKKDF